MSVPGSAECDSREPLTLRDSRGIGRLIDKRAIGAAGVIRTRDLRLSVRFLETVLAIAITPHFGGEAARDCHWIPFYVISSRFVWRNGD